jgi:hypothetical protein
MSPAGKGGAGVAGNGGAGVAGGGGAAGLAGNGGGGGDALSTSFAFVGCNRLSKSDWDATKNPSSANVPELEQTLADVGTLSPAPAHFFMTGDLVLGLNTDTTVLAGQLDGWATLWSAHPTSKKTDLVPLVGNHEMLQKTKVAGSSVELSNPDADGVWTAWQKKSGFDSHAGNGPTDAAPNADALADDQRALTYSFDDGGVHYVVLNTDTWTTTPDASTQSTQIGWVARHWLEKDLAAAQASAGVSSIFVLGHKPIVSPLGLTTSADAINPMLASDLAALIDGTPKVKAYLCAHAHQWDASKLPGKRGVYQVVAGNGGSALESGWNVATPYFGFTQVRVYASGKVGVTSFRRPAPTPYDSTMVAPAMPEAELVISP